MSMVPRIITSTCLQHQISFHYTLFPLLSTWSDVMRWADVWVRWLVRFVELVFL